MLQIDIAGLKINALTKQELLGLIFKRLNQNQRTWITTVYSEFLFAALMKSEVMQMLNQADITVADGIGIFWAKQFLDIPLTLKNYWLKILEAFWQVLITLFSLPLAGRAGEGGDRIPGSELIWDIASLAAKNNQSVYLLGGFGDTPKIVADKLASKYPNILICGYSSKNANDPSVIADINNASPRILLVAYGPIKQEQWIYEHRDVLPSVKLFVGLGGSFDYIAGVRISPPLFVRKVGLEWLWRLFTQPFRYKRIWNATFGLINSLWRYKVFSSYPLRKNVAIVIVNKNNQVLICQRNPRDHFVDIIQSQDILGENNYWQFPQGGIDIGEDAVMAAKREALEEAGLKDLELIKISSQTHTYEWNNSERKFWKNRRHQNRGQTQQIVYLKYHGEDKDVKIDNHEFVDFKWVSINQLENIIHPERLPLAKIVAQDFEMN